MSLSRNEDLGDKIQPGNVYLCIAIRTYMIDAYYLLPITYYLRAVHFNVNAGSALKRRSLRSPHSAVLTH